MPQISQLAATYGGQLFWLLLTFGAIYLIVGRGMVPKIQDTVDRRDGRIADDLASARRANAAADASEEVYRARANETRQRARATTQTSAVRAAKETEARVMSVTEELDARQAQAEAAIARRRDAALVEIEGVAAEAAQSIVAKLSPVTVTRPEAARAVQAVLNG